MKVFRNAAFVVFLTVVGIALWSDRASASGCYSYFNYGFVASGCGAYGSGAEACSVISSDCSSGCSSISMSVTSFSCSSYYNPRSGWFADGYCECG